MDCHQAREWLLRADDPHPERCGLPELTEHLKGCAACAWLAVGLQRLEQAWRDVPLPADSHRARDAFLQRLPAAVAAAARQPLPILRRFRTPRWTAAAALFLVAGVALWMLFFTPQAGAAPDVVERLVEWNLALAEAPTLEERKKLYAEKAKEFTEAVAGSQLSPEDKDLSKLLLDNGTWLASNDDPVTEADRFNGVADKLLERMNSAATHGKNDEAGRFAYFLRNVREHGIEHSMKRAREGAIHKDVLKQQLKKFENREKEFKSNFEKALEHLPKGVRSDIRRGFETPRKGFSPKGAPKGGRRGGR
jgi:hypothetical protein